jgi:peptidoglycan/xylan/chitin deacetylase (PgdA/CDA1 family)
MTQDPRLSANRQSVENPWGSGLSEAGYPFVLMYHSVAMYRWDPYLITVDPARFDKQMRWLRRRGLTGVSMRELVEAWRAGHARRLVGLTFDDGYTDFVDNVLPTLLHHGFTATVFVISGRLGGHNAWDPDGPRKALMTAEQVQQAAAQGMEIGSHGRFHRSLSELGDVELHDEVTTSRQLLQDVSGQEVPGFCYPYGDISAEVIDAVASGGYEYGCAIWRSGLSGDLALPRTYVGDKDSSLRLLAKQIRHRRAARKDCGRVSSRFLRAGERHSP